MSNESDYTKLDDISHVLKCPDVYMGALKNTEKELYTFDGKNVKLEKVYYNTGLLKIFDEILTNASDNLQRPSSGIKNISVNFFIDSKHPEQSGISIYNDGSTIPIKLHESGIYIPELIFTQFRSGSNFTNRTKTTGGKNGIGSKLTSVYSTLFEIEIVNDGKRYYQRVENNCRTVNPPEIEKLKRKEKSSITITFIPDYEKLGTSMTPDNLKVLFKRVHDLSYLPINIYLNDSLLPKLTWKQYVNSFNMGTDLFCFTKDRWNIAFGIASTKARAISYVNNIATYDGGEHVKYILNQIYDYIKTKIPDVQHSTLKSKLVVFVSAIIDDPLFNSQAKEKLTSQPKSFGTTCIIPEKILSAFVESTDILELLKPKQKTTKTQTKRGKLTSIEKLVEANKAGTAEGWKCTLFLCEGLSAKTMCDKGIGILGHDYYGCYPLRGKVLNARNASENKYDDNRELSDIKEIIGLQDNVEYTTTKGLRYGKVVCVKDADSDGAAIMGLVINFFESKFPSLLKIEGFFSEFVSPMIKVIYNQNDKKKRRVVPFYNEVEYRRFIQEVSGSNDKFIVKFIKGLATNEDSDIKEYFNNYSDNKIEVKFDGKYDRWLDMAFNSKRTNDRKLWLTTITPDTHLPREKNVPISVIDFIRSDLVLFSYDSCVRSIPSCIDGLKPSQRKIIYTFFNMGNKAYNEIKVFQLGGLVAKKANYHHGDASMNATIIGMAQDYPGSGNNLPLLKPIGQFGSRVENGEDAGAPRYISCCLDKITRLMFPQIDDSLMTIKEEDNQKVEPFYYVPIIPTILVNGAKGIGTGWSTDIPSFDPIEIINYIRCILNGETPIHIHSFYKDFIGKITEESDRWNYHGVVEKVNNHTYIVKELPVRYSTSQFIARLNYLSELNNLNSIRSDKTKTQKADELTKLAKKQKINWAPNLLIESFENRSTVEKINFKIEFVESTTIPEVIKALGLVESIKNTNMVAFDKENKIRRFNNIEEIVDEWFDVRYNIYDKRLNKMIKDAEFELKVISNKCRFIEENIKKIIDVKNKAKAEIIDTLEKRGYDKLNMNEKRSMKSGGSDENDEQNVEMNGAVGTFDYLLDMKIYALTKEKYESLKNKMNELMRKLEEYKNLTVEALWLDELNALEEAIIKVYES